MLSEMSLLIVGINAVVFEGLLVGAVLLMCGLLLVVFTMVTLYATQAELCHCDLSGATVGVWIICSLVLCCIVVFMFVSDMCIFSLAR